MNPLNFRQRVTVTFELETPPSAYPLHTSPQAAAHIDKLSFSGNTEALLDALCAVPYSVDVVPVDD